MRKTTWGVVVKIKVSIEIEVPDGATHYRGDILDRPFFFKCTKVAGYDHWWVHEPDRVGWWLVGHSPPHFMKELTPEIDLKL